jgi:cupin fold WbuC family metalloprotein
MKYLTSDLLKTLCTEAAANPRKRKNYNFHRHEEKVQRMLNVIQLFSYLQPHKHVGADNFEFFCCLRGAFGLLVFSPNGDIKETRLFSAQGDTQAIEIPGDTYHTIVALEPDSVLLEIKEGPYSPSAPKHLLPGFPDELVYLQNGPNSPEGKKIIEMIQTWMRLFRAV